MLLSKKNTPIQLTLLSLLCCINALAHPAMNWQPDPAAPSLCQGYYVQKLTPELRQTPVTIRQGRTEITADDVSLTLNGDSLFRGDVVVIQPGRRLHADQAIVHRDALQQKFTQAELSGNVSLQEAGKVINADNAYIDLMTHQARLEQASLRFATADALEAALSELGAEDWHAPKYQPQQTLFIHGLTARAAANQIKQVNPDIFLMEDAWYSTCPPGNEAWRLSASKLKLNRATGLGSAANVKLHIKEVPVFYWPYLLFPIDDSRRSGLLLPLISHSKSGGVDFSQPIYWDIAPNYDFLLTPRYMQKRGVLWQGQFRYLNNRALGIHQGELRAGIIGHDSDFNHFRDQTQAELATQNTNPPELPRLLNASAKRDFIRWHHHSEINDYLSWHAVAHHVSDDYVLQDFGRLGLESTTNQLPQHTWLTWDSEHWRALLEYSKYQTLHPVNKPNVREQYRQQPHLALDGYYPDFWNGLNFHFSGDAVDYDRKQNPGEIKLPEIGQRVHVQPGISYLYQVGLGAYLKPRLDLAITHYDLDHIPDYRDDDFTRTLPIFSLDAGLFLEASVNLFGRQYTHTLEPRAFFLAIPNKNQDDYPLFDTTQNMFTFDQLFRTNRFSGLDRIGDAKQLSLALTSRLLDLNGSQKAHFSLGSIIYFQDRNVALCQTTASGDCLDQRSLVVRESLSDTSTLSPLVSQFGYYLHPDWQIAANAALDTDKHRLANGSLSVNYVKNGHQFIRTGLSYLRGGDVLYSVSSKVRDGRDLKQLNTAMVWPLGSRWRVLGRYHYNLSHEYTQDYLAGIEYESCCWALRLVAGRTYKGLNNEHKLQYNRAIYLQWQMKGLATVGTNHPSHYLIEQIPGYQDSFADALPRFI